MRKAFTIGTSVGFLVGLAVVAAPAGADTTNANFTLTGGGLSLSVPTNPTVNLSSSLAIGSVQVAGALNPTTVTDQRGSLLASWKVQVTGSDFVTGASTTGTTADDYTIPKANANMYIDVAELTALVPTGGMVVSSAALTANKANLAAPATPAEAPTLIAGTTAGNGSITYTPSIAVTIPAAAIAGTYSGSVVQTAS